MSPGTQEGQAQGVGPQKIQSWGTQTVALEWRETYVKVASLFCVPSWSLRASHSPLLALSTRVRLPPRRLSPAIHVCIRVSSNTGDSFLTRDRPLV